MRVVTIDFETYWDQTHTLSKLSPTEYVMSPKTEIISVAVKVNDAPTHVVFGEEQIGQYLRGFDWSTSMALGHNMSGFDAMILAWRFGIKPKLYACTAAMARSKYSKTGVSVGGKYLTGVSLKKLSAELGVGRKLDLEATNTKGKYLKDFTPEELEAMREYNKVDTDLCYELFRRLYKLVPKQEMRLIDMTTRMLVEPQFELDYQLVYEAIAKVKALKKQSLLELAARLDVQPVQGVELDEVVRARLASAPMFSALLKDLGVDVPMKTSPTNPDKEVPALAKTDEAFIALQEHDNPLVAAAARARLEVKSTILETRLEAFVTAADACGGRIPAPLKYAGADTTGRWSGEQYNMQNLPRVSGKPSDALRNSLRAPRGHKIVVADLSGIELRVNMFLWQVPYAMQGFASSPDKFDLYKYFAAHNLYNVQESDVTKQQRQVGKVAHLGLGFGAGAATFQKVAKLMGGVDMGIDEATEVVETYREAHSEIAGGWKKFQAALPNIKQGTEEAIDPWGLCVTGRECVRLPSGRSIYYPGIERKRDDKGKHEWWYGAGRTAARIYAGKGVENLVQSLARDVIAEHAVKFRASSGLSPALMVHDELVYIVPEAKAQSTLDELQSIMRSGVSWWPELVTWSEGDIADTYGAAK